MRRRLPFVALLAFSAVCPSFGQTGRPHHAQTLLNYATRQAKIAKKTVFVLFDASW